MTVNEMLKAFPDIRREVGPTFSGWAAEQQNSAIAYSHGPRIARFKFILDLIEARQFQMALWVVPPSDQAMAAHLTR
jgi:hypothetical protein